MAKYFIINIFAGTLHFTAVEKQDGQPNLIYQCAATSPVLHGEYRAGNEFQLIVNPAKSISKLHILNRQFPFFAYLNIFFNAGIESHFVGRDGTAIHKLWFSPEEVSAKIGAKLKLMCIFGGR